MLDVHPLGHVRAGWREFAFHIVTITVGLLIAIALEQSVEKLHRLHQRHQLQHDLREEAERNRETLRADLALESERAWFESALTAAEGITGATRATVSLPPTPCIPGTLGANGTSAQVHTHFFAPSDAVWVTARDASLIERLPVAEARMYSRLAHNNTLLAGVRDRMETACDAVAALQRRYATLSADGASASWTLTGEQAARLADVAAQADTALQALLWRLRWVLTFEEGILKGQTDVDQILMNDAVTPSQKGR
jgi:hypothetical protein